MASDERSKGRAASESSTRRRPISRESGESLLIDAASTLLRSRTFSSVSVRDIARLADVNQRFIHEWFGSQRQLYLAVLEKAAADIEAKFNSFDASQTALNPFDGDLKFAVRLLFWLHLEGVDVSSVMTYVSNFSQKFADRIARIYQVDAETAGAVALQARSIVLGTSAFAPLFGTEDLTKFAKIVQVWNRQMQALSNDDLGSM